ncbi:hypothetical protein RZS08_10495, partial [Arthrospira platensis SPKY1]|nr:hypothetical protein [Arthrospira platensis SPKY1]
GVEVLTGSRVEKVDAEGVCRQAAVVDFGWIRFSGALAWWLWGVAHMFFLVDPRKRISVVIEWFWAYLTYRRGTGLITGGRE